MGERDTELDREREREGKDTGIAFVFNTCFGPQEQREHSELQRDRKKDARD